MKRHRVLIWGGGFANKGAEAMVRTAVEQLGRRIHGAQFAIEGIRAESSAILDLDVDAVPVRRGDTPWRERWETRRFRWPRYLTLRRRLRDVAALVDVSGFAFGGVGCERGAWRLLSVVEQLTSKGAPTVMLPQAWGPFCDPTGRAAVDRILQHARLVYARDDASLAYLCELPHYSTAHVRRATDITFLFDGISPHEACKCVSAVGIDTDKQPLVVVSPNQRVYEQTLGNGSENEYVRLLAFLAERLVRQHGAAVLVLPHEILPAVYTRQRDDRYLCTLVRDVLLARGISASALTGNMTAQEIKGIIGCAKALIGSRFHSIVAAVSQNVPAVAIGWSHKYEELLREVALEEFAFSCKQLDRELITERLDSLWERKDSIRERLQVLTPAMKQQVRQQFDDIVQVLEHSAWRLGA